MIDVILQSALLILCGIAWRRFEPQGLDARTLRSSLTSLVYVLLLPALVVGVLWRAELGVDTVKIALLAACGVVAGMGLAWLWFRIQRPSSPRLGALLLAAAFPNATYLGLPVLETSLGSWAREVAIQYDLFACTPLLLSVGVLLAARMGEGDERPHPLASLLRVPPLWAAVIGVALNLSATPQPAFLRGLLDMLGGGVVPLMLFSIGLSLQWSNRWLSHLSMVVPVVVIQMLITPLLILFLASEIGMTGGLRTAVVLEAAMPSMVLGIVLCDRYRLDSALYAMTVTLSTATALVTLPLWFQLLQQ